MDWFVIDKEYVEYLKRFDYRVARVDYGERLKLHIGVLLKINDYKYYVPVSSPKEKHEKMRNGIDFHKIIDISDGKLYAVININNMIPVPDQCIMQLKYNNIQKFRNFSTEKERLNYIYLLQKEKSIIDEDADVLRIKAQKLFEKVCSDPESLLAKRCCNFKLLQEKASEYTK